jgi:Reverse transcriptase (RNA-dependent DNA polymerase)
LNLSFISKVLERFVVCRFTSFASKHSLFPVMQPAYRTFHPNETAVLIVHNNLVHSIDSGRVVSLAFLDLGSAFDTVNHSILLSIFSNRFYTNGFALDWFTSYRSDLLITLSLLTMLESRLRISCYLQCSSGGQSWGQWSSHLVNLHA